MIVATGITLLFVAATSALTAWSRLRPARHGDRASLGGVVVGGGMALWCLVAGLWWLGVWL